MKKCIFRYRAFINFMIKFRTILTTFMNQVIWGLVSLDGGRNFDIHKENDHHFLHFVIFAINFSRRLVQG